MTDIFYSTFNLTYLLNSISNHEDAVMTLCERRVDAVRCGELYARCNGKNIIHMFAHNAATLQRAGRFSERHGKPEERGWIIQHVCFKSCVFMRFDT